MKRSENRKIGPGFWYGVGGHLEPDEINIPYDACLREIQEETGIGPDEIEDLQMKYIVMRRGSDEIVLNYFFFGRTLTRAVTASDEGTLTWVPESEVLEYHFFEAIRLTLAHYLETGRQTDGVLVGVVDRAPGSAIQWTPLHDMSQGG